MSDDDRLITFPTACVWMIVFWLAVLDLLLVLGVL